MGMLYFSHPHFLAKVMTLGNRRSNVNLSYLDRYDTLFSTSRKYVAPMIAQ